MFSPYQDDSTNLLYNLLFCDDIELYKSTMKPPVAYPFDVLFSEKSSVEDLQNIIDNNFSESRVVALAYLKQRLAGHPPEEKDILGVIVEVGLDDGLDVLASFKNATARYINYTGKIIIWEAPNQTVLGLTNELMNNGMNIVNRIGVWDKQRLPPPVKGNVRISFLVSDGLYFGEGPINVLFNDRLAGPALKVATQLMQLITEISLEKDRPIAFY